MAPSGETSAPGHGRAGLGREDQRPATSQVSAETSPRTPAPDTAQSEAGHLARFRGDVVPGNGRVRVGALRGPPGGFVPDLQVQRAGAGLRQVRHQFTSCGVQVHEIAEWGRDGLSNDHGGIRGTRHRARLRGDVEPRCGTPRAWPSKREN